MEPQPQSPPSQPSQPPSTRRFFLKQGDAAPPLVNGQRTSWRPLGAGLSYFVTSDHVIVTALAEAAAKKLGGVFEVTEEEFAAKKDWAQRTQSEIERTRSDSAPRPLSRPTGSLANAVGSNPLGQPARPPQVASAAPAVAPSMNVNQQFGPPQKNLLPVVAPVAEPAPVFTAPSTAAGEANPFAT